jgi:outer membrane protein OmpA-like peptidoglycan-associated protein
MKRLTFIALLSGFLNSWSQGNVILKPGDEAPFFIVTVDDNSIRSFLMPYQKKLLLLHFWGSDNLTSRLYGKRVRNLFQKYRSAVYKNAEGFEVIAIAVQSDKNAWKKAIKEDTLATFIHGIAVKGLSDEACRRYGVFSLPTDILVDENGKVVVVDPKIAELEDILDDRKNIQPIRKDLDGLIAQSSNKNDVLKFTRVYLLNAYGDSLSKVRTTDKGMFHFTEVKLNHDLVMKVDNQLDFVTSDPMAIYTPAGEFLMDGKTAEGGFVFNIPVRITGKLTPHDTSKFNPLSGMLDVIKHLNFKNNGEALTPKDEEELSVIISTMQKNKSLKLEFVTHADARLDSAAAMDLTAKQANAVRKFVNAKGVPLYRITAIAKGNMELRKLCVNKADCGEEDHRLNRRVEFQVYTD